MVIQSENSGHNGPELELFRLFQQMLDFEVLRIALGEHAQQLALPAMSLAAEIIEPLHAARQPGGLGGRDA